MKFCWITLHVENLEASLKFYHEILGLPISSQMDTPDMKMVMLGDGEAKVELIWTIGQENPIVGNYTSIGFTVSSLEETVKLLKEHGIDDIRGPIHPNPQVRFMFVKDPNGYEVQFVEQL